MKIFKYGIEIVNHQILSMPEGAQILSVQEQMGQIQLWAIVEPNNALQEYALCIFGTGRQMPSDMSNFVHIDTFQQAGGALVWHIFLEQM
ncbi:MAG: hypothetical protein COA78_07105 [Blastopirellula sp.]|nr:MAG: hypothetical protein COA78_07105 [Blastopirellula sp.]